MLGLDVKRGVEATLERVYNSTGGTFKKLSVTWAGKTAGVTSNPHTGDVHVVFPGIDESKQIDKDLFNQLIGYAMHELGHVWFTTNQSWEKARSEHGAFVSALINGLEDPRIEQAVIDSGYAPNARQLFEHLVNRVLQKDGYVEPDDFKNIPFLLAVEGRRLNGYDLCFPSVVDASPYAKHLRWALKAAQKATDTPRIVKIAIDLYDRLKQQQQEQQQQQDEKQQEEQEGQQGVEQDGEPGEEGSPGDQKGGEDSKESEAGSGHDEEGGRPVEPDQHITKELESSGSKADRIAVRPHPNPPEYDEFTFI